MMSGVIPELWPIKPVGSREARASEVCPLVNRGMLLLPKSAPWLSAFEKEVGGFPLEATSDITDALVHALKFATSRREFPERPQREGPMAYGSVEDVVTIDDPHHPMHYFNDLSVPEEVGWMLGADYSEPVKSFDIHNHSDLDQRLLDALDPDGSKRI